MPESRKKPGPSAISIFLIVLVTLMMLGLFFLSDAIWLHSASPSPTNPISSSSTPYLLSGGYFNCHQGPSTSSPVHVILKGQEVTVIAQNQSRDWLYVRVQNFDDPCWVLVGLIGDFNGDGLSDLVSMVPIYVGTITPSSTDMPFPTTKTVTPDANQMLHLAFNEVDRQFQESIRSNIAYNAPKTMKLDETITIELLLNPSLSQDELATQLVERSDLLTSSVDADQLVTKDGEAVDVVTSEVSITNRMKTVLRSQKSGAFEIQELHDNSDQPISNVDTTKWRWSVTAKEQGTQTLELVLYRLIKLDDDEYWREVETYKADINVDVTVSQRLKSLDWKWILGILATALLLPLFFRWYDNRKKKGDEPKTSKPPTKKYHSK